MLHYLKQEMTSHFICWEIHPFLPVAICADDECASERIETIFCVAVLDFCDTD